MYRKCIYGVVPCSHEKVVCFIKGSQVKKHHHNHCFFFFFLLDSFSQASFSLVAKCFMYWFKLSSYILHSGVAIHKHMLDTVSFLVHCHYNNRIWAFHQLCQPVACFLFVFVERALLIVIQASATLSMYKQWICKNYTVYLGFDFIVQEALSWCTLKENCGTFCFLILHFLNKLGK